MSMVRAAGVVRQSIVDGPGFRLTLFTQGCPHRCPGCHNPDTHDPSGGYDCSTDTIVAELERNPLLSGVTFSGGEPFLQAGVLVPLAREIRRRGKNLWCYSGFTFEELLDIAREDHHVERLLHLTDILVDGPYLQLQRDLTLPFRGSRNQRLVDVPRSLMAGHVVEYDLALYRRSAFAG